jgi:protein TonB
VTTPPPKQPGISAPALIMGGKANCAANYYPPIAVRLNQEGTVTLSVHIGADGNVQSADVTNSSGHDSIDAAGIKCVTNAWHFKPAMENGQPVAVTRLYAIKFVLQGG